MSLLLALQSTAAELVGTALLSITTAGDLTTGIPLLGSADVVVTTAGVLTTGIPLLGTADIVVTADADLTAPGAPVGVFPFFPVLRRRRR